jgi:hypothetical protein
MSAPRVVTSGRAIDFTPGNIVGRIDDLIVVVVASKPDA